MRADLPNSYVLDPELTSSTYLEKLEAAVKWVFKQRRDEQLENFSGQVWTQGLKPWTGHMLGALLLACHSPLL